MYHHRSLTRLLLLAAGVAVLASVVWDDLFVDQEKKRTDEDGGDDASKSQNLYDLSATTGIFGTLGVALKTAGLVDTISEGGPYTIFAPTDDAFSKLGESLDELLADEEKLIAVLKNHLVEGSVMSGDLEDGAEVTTQQGTTLAVAVDGDTITVGGATVTDADLVASNGVIHGIDTVLQNGGNEKKKRKKSKRKSTDDETNGEDE